MFQKDKNSQLSDKVSSSATLISSGTVLTGDVSSDSDLRVDGTIHGNVSCSARIVVGPNGYIEGNIEGKQADITGRVTGNIQVQETLQLRAQSNVQGNISAATLQIDPAAVFNGQCKMGAPGTMVVLKTIDEAKVAVQ